ncbi:MAG TPA: hypothetical protein ENN19_02390 [Chloroflexi bacterium]|nr:hypothetical protein [Chloroflexota bacterium]
MHEFARAGRHYVLRVSPPSDEISPYAMKAILAWMRFLAERGASVTKPILSTQGNLVECIEQEEGRYVVVAFDKATGVLAEELSLDRWNERLFETLGRTAGQMHALAKVYVPASDALRRPGWDQTGNCFNPVDELETLPQSIQEKRVAVLKHVRTLPKDRDSYGLIHADFHGGNFFVDTESGTITVFDFDDCAYGCFVMDVAMNLFDMLVLYAGGDAEAFATKFMKAYLRGYRDENPLGAFWIGQLPHFLKLLEIGVYAQVHQYHDPEDPDPWVGKFMVDRRYRIEHDGPYVDVDFEEMLS